MRFPKENIWQEIRRNSLEAIPRGSTVSPRYPITLARWQARGCYQVTGATSKKFELSVSPVEFGSALLTDAEYLLDGAAEHQVSLWKQINSSEWSSPAWLGVTTYYWAYYLLLAYTRMTGTTAWFITGEITRSLKSMAPATAVCPGAGCFRLNCHPRTTITERPITLTKSGSRVHDEAWRLFFRSCSSSLKRLAVNAPGTDERRVFTAIERSANRLGGDWPSALRNTINYRPGFAYAAVRNKQVLKSFAYLRSPTSYDIADLVNSLENCVVAAQKPDSITSRPQQVLELLVILTFHLYAMATDLHEELISRHGLDTRWRNRRTAFLRNHGLSGDSGTWPQ